MTANLKITSLIEEENKKIKLQSSELTTAISNYCCKYQETVPFNHSKTLPPSSLVSKKVQFF